MLTKVHVDRESFPDIDYAISYDGNRRIEKIVKTGDADKTISMAYNADDQVTTMAVTGDQAGVYELQYDALKRVNKIVSNGTETQVSYDTATQSYIVN